MKIQAHVSVKNFQKIAEKIQKEFITPKLLQQVQTLVIDTEIKRLVAAGISPVKGKGRFGEYVNPANYPGKGQHRKKPSRPVNLYLTGAMMKEYKVTPRNATGFYMGIHHSAPDFVKNKAEWNNYGTERNGVGAVPPRRFIPARGEIYAVSIMRQLKNLFTARIKELLLDKKK